MTHTVFISLGSNLGHRLNHLRSAVEELKKHLVHLKTSVVIETKALLLKDSPKSWDLPYLNMIVSGETDLEPLALLDVLQSIEQKLGRNPIHPKWSPRTIDLDILLYDQLILNTERLTLPHKSLRERDFLLHLMASLAPNLTHPDTHTTFEALAHAQQSTNEFVSGSSFTLFPQLMGIVNITPDSFSDGGRYLNAQQAVEHCNKLLKDGASILDIGAQSTRPGALQLNSQTEWERLCPVLDLLNLKEIPVSIDTYREDLIEKLLHHYPIARINDVSGKLSAATLKMIAQAGCKICVMHSLTIPPNSKDLIAPDWLDIDLWAQQQIEKLIHCGFDTENIVLDPGFGFGKTAYTSGYLLKTIEHMHSLGCRILVGHSRKSFLNLLGHRPAIDKDIETLAVSQYLKDKVDYLRIHNVEIHQRFLATQQWIENYHEHTNH